jgi:hypothetical protein
MQLVAELKETHLGYIRVLEGREGRAIEKVFSFIAGEKAAAFTQVLEGRKEADHGQLARLMGFRTEQEGRGLTRVRVLFRLYGDTLETARQRSGFEEQEAFIWGIAQQLNQALVFFEQEECFHGDLNLLTVFLEDGRVRVHDPLFFERLSSSQLLALSRANKSFLPPELYLLALEHNFHPGQLDVRCDVFSFGVIMLALGTGLDPLRHFDHGFPCMEGLFEDCAALREVCPELADLVAQCLQGFVDRPFPSRIAEMIRSRNSRMIERLPLSSSLTDWSQNSLMRESLIEERINFEGFSPESTKAETTQRGLVIMDFS